MFTIYGAYRNADETEGRGPMRLVLLLADRDEMVKYIEAQPDPWHRHCTWRDNRYGDWEMREHRVFQSAEEVDEYAAGEPRRRALAKLTDEDKRVLGL